MPVISATEAKNQFGRVLDMARTEPVRINRNGRDVVVVVAAEAYDALVARASAPKVQPIVDKLLARSIERRRSLYEALAK